MKILLMILMTSALISTLPLGERLPPLKTHTRIFLFRWLPCCASRASKQEREKKLCFQRRRETRSGQHSFRFVAPLGPCRHIQIQLMTSGRSRLDLSRSAM